MYGAAACSADRHAAREHVKSAVAGMGASVFRPTIKGKHVPRELEKLAVRLRDEYEITQHMEQGDDQNEHLIDRLGLTRRLTNISVSTPTSGRNTAIVNQIVWSVKVSMGMRDSSSHVDDHEHDGSDGGGAEQQCAVLVDSA